MLVVWRRWYATWEELPNPLLQEGRLIGLDLITQVAAFFPFLLTFCARRLIGRRKPPPTSTHDTNNDSMHSEQCLLKKKKVEVVPPL